MSIYLCHPLCYTVNSGHCNLNKHFKHKGDFNMKTIAKKIAVLTLAFALAVAGVSTFVNMDNGVQVANDGPIDEGCWRP